MDEASDSQNLISTVLTTSHLINPSRFCSASHEVCTRQFHLATGRTRHQNRGLPDAELMVAPGTSHGLPVDKPDQCNLVIVPTRGFRGVQEPDWSGRLSSYGSVWTTTSCTCG
jgi:hypothetical protein